MNVHKLGRAILMAVCVAALGRGATAQATMISVENTLTSWAYSGRDGGVEQRVVQVNVAAPYSQQDEAVAGETTSMTSYDFSDGANGAALVFGFHHARDDSLESVALSDAEFDFQIDRVMPFKIEGDYGFSGGEQKFVRVRLYENPQGQAEPIFDWMRSVTDDRPDSLAFFHNGELAPGTMYRLEYRFMIAGVTGQVEARADGALRLTIGDVSPDGILGDTNGDRRVDIDDLNGVRNNFGGTGPSDGSLAGDAFPFDGTVDIDDLNAVRNNFGAVAAALPVPEPSGLSLLTLAVAIVTGAAVRKR